MDFVKDTLKDEIKEAKISGKLRNQPVCLTADGSLSFEMEKYLNQVQPDNKAHAERVLELNAEHPIFQKLKELQESDRTQTETYVKILFYQAELMAGLPINNPSSYSELVFGLM